jgi:hypothetical protein
VLGVGCGSVVDDHLAMSVQSLLDASAQGFWKAGRREVSLQTVGVLPDSYDIAVGSCGIAAGQPAPGPGRSVFAGVTLVCAGRSFGSINAGQQLTVVNLKCWIGQRVLGLGWCGDGQAGEPLAVGEALSVCLSGRAGYLFTAGEALVVLDQRLGAEQELFEDDLVEESRVGSA